MIANTNDGSAAPPRLRCYFNLMALEGLAGKGFEAIREAGYEGVQFVEPATEADLARCRGLGLGVCGSGRINEPGEARALAERAAGEGLECATIHLGWGLEDDDEAARLIESVLDASARHGVPLYVETHRATVFQDMWRTAQFVRRFPELRFNGDFSHWYTGLEMVYGGFERKLRFIAPVLERVRFVHGRIGNPGSIQVAIGGGEPCTEHFRRMWSAAFAGFRATARPGDYICFAPELLAARIYYARTFPDATGAMCEESDRWEQSLLLARIARECFEA
ncbi:MAG: sugar phosphate isomerase/epimerase family protein [Acidobacteriota bacterium]